MMKIEKDDWMMMREARSGAWKMMLMIVMADHALSRPTSDRAYWRTCHACSQVHARAHTDERACSRTHACTRARTLAFPEALPSLLLPSFAQPMSAQGPPILDRDSISSPISLRNKKRNQIGRIYAGVEKWAARGGINADDGWGPPLDRPCCLSGPRGPLNADSHVKSIKTSVQLRVSSLDYWTRFYSFLSQTCCVPTYIKCAFVLCHTRRV